MSPEVSASDMTGVSGKIVAFQRCQRNNLHFALLTLLKIILASATSSCGEFVLFCRAAESHLDACLSVVRRRKLRTRSVLVGQTLRHFPSSVEHRALFTIVDLANVLCKASQFSEGHAVTFAVMASTVNCVWNDRGMKDAVDRVQP